MSENRLTNKGIFGVILVLIGLAFIARNFNWFTPGLENALLNWPMLLVVIGVFVLINNERSLTGWVLLAIGGAFWVPRFFDIPFDFHDVFWPVLFIGIGLVIILRGFRPSNRKLDETKERDYLDDLAVFGGNERRVSSRAFKGGRITAMLGGSTINLLDADLAPGENLLDVFVLMGGTTLIVPEHWDVKVEVSSIFGGFSDKRTAYGEAGYLSENVLVIKGVAVFGGGEIKNA